MGNMTDAHPARPAHAAAMSTHTDSPMDTTTTRADAPAANVAAVGEIYAAFGRGDVEAIAARVTPDCSWSLGLDRAVPGAPHLPNLERFEGPDGVRAYFGAVAASLAIDRFEIEWIVPAGDEVVSLLHVGATLATSGRHVEFDEIHRFRFAPDGRIDRYRPSFDTATVLATALGHL
jgi:ketosteroid isomerase-like protein